jgi:O-methyltransferase involved in polyketide biosynthesis
MQQICPLDAEGLEYTNQIAFTIPFFEARYRATNYEISKYGAKQVVELAAGLSPRGIIMTEDPLCNFVEVDLPMKISLKKEIVERLVAKKIITPRPNLHFVERDVTDRDFEQIRSLLRKEAVTFVCEGLLRWLSIAHKTNLFQDIHATENTVVWIAPDYEVKDEDAALPEVAERLRELAARSNMDVSENLFANRAEMVRFCEEQKFAINIYPLTRFADGLLSPKLLHLHPQDYLPFMSVRGMMIMTPQ